MERWWEVAIAILLFVAISGVFNEEIKILWRKARDRNKSMGGD